MREERTEDAAYAPAADPDDLEEVEVVRKPRGRQGAVISVRLPLSDAEALANLAAQRGMNVSQLARAVLYQTLSAQWRVGESRLGATGVSMNFSPTGGLGGTIRVKPDLVPQLNEARSFEIQGIGGEAVRIPIRMGG